MKVQIYDHDTLTSQTGGQTDRRLAEARGNAALYVESCGKNSYNTVTPGHVVAMI